MDKYFSNKIKLVSFLLIIMVVFLHSYNIDIKQGGKILNFEKNSNWIVQNFISNGITRIAVPLFFLISGFLFVSKQTFNFEDYKIKINKRLKTLVIPYLFWSLLGLFLYLVLQSFPQSCSFFTNKLIKNYSIIEWINAIIIRPIPYQLWFLKDLIVMVFISPLIFFFTRKLKIIYLFIVAVFWFFNQDNIILTSEALLFFSIGIYIQLFYKESVYNKSNSSVLLVLFWLFFILLKTIAGYYDYSKIAEILLLKISILFGIVAFWKILDKQFVLNFSQGFIEKILSYSFFIYAFHEPYLTIIKKALFAMLSKTPTNYLIVYFLSPIIIIFISLFVAMILKNNILAFYKIITGNR